MSEHYAWADASVGSGTQLAGADIARRAHTPFQLTRQQTRAAIANLDMNGLHIAMREGWFEVRTDSGETQYIATDALSAALCKRSGRQVDGLAGRQDVLDAILEQDGPALTQQAANQLAEREPELSARQMLTSVQWLALAITATGIAGMTWFVPQAAKLLLVVMFSALFLCISGLKLLSIMAGGKVRLPDGPTIDDAQLPVYTVLVPLYKEAGMVRQLLRSLNAINYPADKLDVKIIVEEDDEATGRQARRQAAGLGFDVISVAPGSPQTKPRALNLALQFARGELVTIYDAEDIPQPMQLRLAAECFASAPPELACLQARLAYYNANENWLTRQFTIEYASLFDLLLPMLSRFRLPLPLGGTSNHFRYSALQDVGGWDAWNVTEDADLGLRLARFGYRCEVLSSTTFEEANCRLGNWLHQRARWLKGWMQTWIVVMRQPVSSMREMGPGGFAMAQLTMAGMIVSALLHPIFLVLLAYDQFIAPERPPGIAELIYDTSAITVLVAGYLAAMLAGAFALVKRRMFALLPAVLTMPVYWLLISLGGWLALWQLIRAPYHWNKTVHGISRMLQHHG